MTWPCSGPKTSSTFSSRRSATRARALDERRVELARGLLELRAHELGVDAGQLAVEHARADLDRLDHEAHRVLALAGQARGGLVVDGQLLDVQPPVADVDLREGETDGSFHERRRTVRPAPDGTAACNA